MSSGYEVVDEDHVGGRDQVASEWKTIRAVFHNFANLPSKRGDQTESKVLKCHGLEWQIQLYPGGHTKTRGEDVSISFFLSSVSCSNANKIRAKHRIRVPSAGKGVTGNQFNIFSPGVAAWGGHNYAKREGVLDPSKNFLVDGNLTVEVDIQVMLDTPPLWTPTNQIKTACSDMLAFFDAADADNADISFEVASGDGRECLRAHSAILAARCPTLASLAEGCDSDTPIPIGDVQANVFRMLLRYIYGGEVPSKEVINEQAKDIIRVADRFECTGLKLTAEAEMTAAGITTENAAELILFADATNCAMLKEAAMEYFVTNAQAVMESEGFGQVKESPAIMAELMAVALGGSKKRPASSDADRGGKYKQMRLVEIYRELDLKGLDVEGPKEMLLSRLKAADEEEKKKKSIIVSGAGLDKVNGLYQRTAEICDGLPVYKMQGSWRGRPCSGSYCLFRCRLRNENMSWYISFVPQGVKPGTTKDVDFYHADSMTGIYVDYPPATGWCCCSEGVVPPPNLRRSGEE